jgi:hypothetical protein
VLHFSIAARFYISLLLKRMKLRLKLRRVFFRGSTFAQPCVRRPSAFRRAPPSARLPPLEGLIRRTREGGSEWEPIKILLEGDENSYKMNTASNTRLRLTTQVGQAHVATGVLLDLGTNTHTLPTRERSGTPNLESTDPHRSDR